MFLTTLEYLLGSVFTLVAILVAIKQFKDEKKPIIIPRNCRFFYYGNFGGRHTLFETPNQKYSPETAVIIDTPIQIKIENVTPNPAIAFDMVIDYKKGELYREICDKIGGEPTDQLKSTWQSKG